jgi:hypothetical protein
MSFRADSPYFHTNRVIALSQTVPPPAVAPSAAKERADRPFLYAYLVSAAHSGSTLIGCLMQAHPEISSPGEFSTPFLPTIRCSCGTPYTECSFWRNWEAKAQDEGLLFDLPNPAFNCGDRPGGLLGRLAYYQFPFRWVNRSRDFLFGPLGHRRQLEAVRRSARLGEILCRIEGTRVFLDISKNPLQIPFLSRLPDVNVKVISLVRDGRGVICSLMKHYKQTREQAVGAWLWSCRNQERVVAQCVDPARVFRLRLEDLCREPARYRSELFRFLGVDDAVELDFSDLTKRHILANTMRLKFTGEVRLDEAWKTTLTKEDLAFFERHGGRRNRMNGYEA